MSGNISATYNEIRNTRKRESVKKYESEKIAEQYEGKGYKTISISSSTSISISLQSVVASAISCSETSLSNGFKTGSLKIDYCPWFGLSCFHSLYCLSQIVIKGATHSKGELI